MLWDLCLTLGAFGQAVEQWRRCQNWKQVRLESTQPVPGILLKQLFQAVIFVGLDLN
jgi:hypothetical protein